MSRETHPPQFTTQHFTKAITQIRTNCRWLVAFTTTNRVTVDYLFDEFAALMDAQKEPTGGSGTSGAAPSDDNGVS